MSEKARVTRERPNIDSIIELATNVMDDDCGGDYAGRQERDA